MSVDLNSVGSRGCLQKMPGTELCLCDKPRWSQAKDSLQIAHSAPGSESTKGSCSSRQTSEPTEELDVLVHPPPLMRAGSISEASNGTLLWFRDGFRSNC